jgi:CPA1 family monovalent cation:H+ antiporter
VLSQILVVMIAAIAVTIIAERRNIQPPLLLALIGLLASFVPGLARLELAPDIILTVVLPPLLFSAAREFSLASFLMRLGSVVNLGVFLVAVTAVTVGAAAAAAIPGMTLAAALVLGAVVSPPDAVTAVAVGRKLRLPTPMMTVLKGESLINDAAALTLFTFAAASVTGTHLAIPNLFLFLLYAAVVGFALGLVIGIVVHRLRLRLDNASLSTVLGVLVPFTAYLVAEEIGASGVLAVVAAGLLLGHDSREEHYAARIQERQFWRTADALLEAFVFAYIGLQLRFVIEDVVESGLPVTELVGLSLLVLATVIAVRIGWVFLTGAVARWRDRVIRRRLDEPQPRPRRRKGRPQSARARAREEERRRMFELLPPFSWKENLVIGWTGMRGVVTLAAAAGIPLVTVAGAPFPGRDVIQVVAFVVALGTLLLQGLSLPWLIRRLKLSSANEDRRRAAQHRLAEELARQASIDTAAAFRDRQADPARRRVAEAMLARFASEQAQAAGPSDPTAADEPLLLELATEVLAARRAAVVKARDARQLDDEVMRDVLEDMDLEQAVMANQAS